jgi:hypothetical protein
MSSYALDADGKLLDASQIDWYNDPDDKEPISASTSACPLTAASSISLMTPSTIGMFFHSLGSPTTKVAGACHSHKAMHPSAKITDLDNMASSSRKCKATSNGGWALTSHHCRVASLLTSIAEPDATDTAPASEVVETDKEDAVANEKEDVEVDGDEPVEDGYLHMKVMANSDCQVRLSYAVMTVMTDLCL